MEERSNTSVNRICMHVHKVFVSNAAAIFRLCTHLHARVFSMLILSCVCSKFVKKRQNIYSRERIWGLHKEVKDKTHATNLPSSSDASEQYKNNYCSTNLILLLMKTKAMKNKTLLTICYLIYVCVCVCVNILSPLPLPRPF